MKKSNSGPSLVAQWLRLGASTAGSVPRWDLLRGMAEKKKVKSLCENILPGKMYYA